MNMKAFYLQEKYFKAFCGLFIFSMIYIFPIILANFYYVDDLLRSMSGDTYWEINGRPLASFLTIAINGGMPLMDVSPWIQILSVAILSYSLILFLKKYVPRATSFQLVCIASCSYFNFFLLENLSYKYDSLGMICSLSLFLILYALPESLNRKKHLALSAVAVLMSLSLYQASIGAYLALCILEYIFLFQKNASCKSVTKRLLLRSLGLLTGGILYKLLVVQIYIHTDGYSVEHSQLVNPLSTLGIQRISFNIAAFSDLFRAYVESLGHLGTLFLAILILGIGCMIYHNWQNRRETVFVKMVISLMFLISPLLLLVASVIPLVLLNIPVFASMVLLSFTIFTLFIGIAIYHLGEVKKCFLAFAVIVMVYSLSFSSCYGNLLNRQESMNTMVAVSLVRDINDLEVESKKKINALSIIGISAKCHEFSLASKNKPLFDWLVPIYMNNNWSWGGQYLSHYRKNPVQLRRDDSDEAYVKANIPLRQNEFYNLYLQDDKVIVLFVPE